MRDSALLGPVFTVAGWTACILLLMACRRLSSGLSPREFVLGESALLANRTYMNLLELPLLSYVVCLVSTGLPSVPAPALGLCWAARGA